MGDDDPLDIVDMTNRTMRIYDIPKLKVIGALSLIDQGELDWKIIAIEEEYAKDRKIRTIEQFNQRNPGALAEVKEWFRTIKTYDGKPENKFAFDHFLSVDETIEVILHNH